VNLRSFDEVQKILRSLHRCNVGGVGWGKIPPIYLLPKNKFVATELMGGGGGK
jgi:hypothetical protein